MMSISMVQEYFVGIICCGNEIPKWFSHKSEGCSIKIELPRDWFSTDFLGFALSLVVGMANGILTLLYASTTSKLVMVKAMKSTIICVICKRMIVVEIFLRCLCGGIIMSLKKL
ncbi:unnamed protein product [Prunus brigantina]